MYRCRDIYTCNEVIVRLQLMEAEVFVQIALIFDFFVPPTYKLADVLVTSICTTNIHTTCRNHNRLLPVRGDKSVL